jgi:endonuclease/exonuclease/phosphatase family metal-dependent hydrolase
MDDLARDKTKHDHARFLRHNVGLVVVLRHRAAHANLLQSGGCTRASLVVVGTTHLYWNPMHEDVKLKQTALFLQRVESVVARLSGCDDDAPSCSSCSPTPCSSAPAVLVCGDFNAMPASSVYRFVVDGAWSPECASGEVRHSNTTVSSS